MLNIDNSIIKYWKSHGISLNDFNCRHCGKMMLDADDLLAVKYRTTSTEKYSFDISTDRGYKTYHESEHNRWLIIGKTINNKKYFRRICWNCFFKLLRETEDIPRKARKMKWYAKVNAGENPIPASCTSPSPYFKLLFDVSDKDLNAARSVFATASREHFITKYGIDEGEKKYEEYRKRLAYTCSREYLRNEKGLTEDQIDEFNASRASTKENYIKRYGEKRGTHRWKEYCAREAYAGNTLMYFVEKFGKDEGLKQYIDVCDKKMFTLRTYSNISQKLFKCIDLSLGEYAEKSRWETKNFEYEFFINIDNIKRIVKVDYYLNGKIIEFNGDYWHANPLIYKANDELNMTGTKKIASTIWKDDDIRLTAIKKCGYDVLVVWENDYRKDPDAIINQCCKFLNPSFVL